MLRFLNTINRYGIVAIVLHWFMALLLIFLIILGLYMVALPEVGFNRKKIALILLHKDIGMIALALALLRFVWRLGNIVPMLPPTIPMWQKIAARTVHLAFYGFMIALPVSGWMMSSAAGIPATILGVFTLPNLVSSNMNKVPMYIEIHKWLGYGLIATIGLHISAAMLHHFVYKDDTLRRMLP
jgi:cytochrome b561